jgi:hypothetical protein
MYLNDPQKYFLFKYIKNIICVTVTYQDNKCLSNFDLVKLFIEYFTYDTIFHQNGY